MRKYFFSVVTVFLSGILLLALSEALLRVSGFPPWQPYEDDLNEPTVHEPDPVLGWKNKAGEYVIPPYAATGQEIHLTFLPDGTRRTGVKETEDAIGNELVIVGGSFTQGLAISDDETYAWKLQERYPESKVMNYGSGAYGTYQSLLVLERELPRLKSPTMVLYGFFDHHEERNVAPGGWLEMLSKLSRRGHVCVPYATLSDNGSLVRHPPACYPITPFRESLSTIAFLDKVYMKITTMKRFDQRRLVTEKLLVEMQDVCETHGAQFAVVLLTGKEETKRHYADFLKKEGIGVIDCGCDIPPEMRVPGEGHPNGKMNSRWAACIAEALGDSIGMRGGSSTVLRE